MPLPAGLRAPGTPGGGLPHPSRLQPKRITWTAPGGDILDLCSDAQGYRPLRGRSGFGLVPREVIYDASPMGGGLFRTIQDQVRLLTIPLRVHATTQADYLTRLHRLQASVRHRYGGQDVPGTITVFLPNGSSRRISAFYHHGLEEHSEELEDLLFTAQNFPTLEFIATDPYWEGGSVGDTWRATAGAAWFGPMPRSLASSQVLGAVTVNVPGDAETHPIWTITGPGVPTITNVTTGRSFAFKDTAPIADGQTVTIDTRDTYLSVVDQDDVNLYSSL
ncbi:MAG TPA: hypothetical protein VIQ30_15385, partial [Pseudonocardia sp.]